jgi:hypothetical protein
LCNAVAAQIGLVLDVGAVHAGSLFGIVNDVSLNRPGVESDTSELCVSSRHTFRGHSRWMPFAQAVQKDRNVCAESRR